MTDLRLPMHEAVEGFLGAADVFDIRGLISQHARGPLGNEAAGRAIGYAVRRALGGPDPDLQLLSCVAVTLFDCAGVCGSPSFREALAASLGVSPEEEGRLLEEIRSRVAADPDVLDMGAWHCRTAHCLAGWCEVLRPGALPPEPMLRRKASNIAALYGLVLLPRHCHRFHDSTRSVRAWLLNENYLN